MIRTTGICKNTLPNKKANYTLQMEYSSTGEINKKLQEHSENGIGTTLNTYAHTYTHEANSHRLEKITNKNGVNEFFEYDNNGNLTQTEHNNVVTTLQWDEANRLKMVTNPHFVQHYLYDASGERVLKTTGRVSEVFVNGELKHSEVRSDGYTVYPNGYLTINSTGIYTKHYYMGAQRLVSRPAVYTPGGWKDGADPELAIPEKNGASLKKTQQADLSKLLAKAGYGEMVYPSSYETDEDTLRAEQPLYYFHPNHLGSSTLLTDNNGNPYQFFLNLSFGETMTEQKASGSYTNPYLFNGKELDEETGLYYYGARYYNPRYSVWLGVDPMAGKYAFLSPYNFTLNNPVVLVDPDGQDPLRRAKNYAQRNNVTKSLKYGATNYERTQNGSVILSWSGENADGEFNIVNKTFNRNFGDKIGSFFAGIFSGLGKNGSGQIVDRGGLIVSSDGNNNRPQPQGPAITTDKANINNADGAWYTNMDNTPFISFPNDKSTNPLINAVTLVNTIVGNFNSGRKAAEAIMANSNKSQGNYELFYEVVTHGPYGLSSKYGSRVRGNNSSDSLNKRDSINNLPGHRVLNESDF